MGAIAPSKMPSGKEKARRDDTDFKQFKKGGLAKQAATAIAMKAAGKKPKKMAAGGELKEVPEDNAGLSKLPTEVRNKMGYMKDGGKVKMAGGGLYANIAAKKKRIASGSGEKMKSVGAKGAPKKSDFANAAKTAKYKEGGETKSKVNEAGNYTKPELRKRIFNSVKAAAVQGTGAGQ
jgi:hypothetical protein